MSSFKIRVIFEILLNSIVCFLQFGSSYNQVRLKIKVDLFSRFYGNFRNVLIKWHLWIFQSWSTLVAFRICKPKKGGGRLKKEGRSKKPLLKSNSGLRIGSSKISVVIYFFRLERGWIQNGPSKRKNGLERYCGRCPTTRMVSSKWGLVLPTEIVS